MQKPYTLAHYHAVSNGFALLLDGKPAQTPLGKAIILPNEPFAEAVAEEFRSQKPETGKQKPDFNKMPITQIACIALDLAHERRSALCADILSYAETDLVCYRAGDIPALCGQQAELLDPIIAWAQDRFGITLAVTDGVMPVAQPVYNKSKLKAVLDHYNNWQLAALAASIKPLGSLVLALALTAHYVDAETAFRLAHLEEAYETQKWGPDAEKEARMEKLLLEVKDAQRFISLLVSSTN